MIKNRKYRVTGILTFILLLLGFAVPVYADIGVPMLAVVWPISWILLIPVILLEAFVAMRIIKKSFLVSLKVSCLSNLASTLVGIPITWVVLVILEMLSGGGSAFGLSTPVQKFLAVTAQSPWLIPYEEELHWMVPAAAAALCIPFFFMSVVFENRVAKGFFEKSDWRLVWRWAWIANAISYGFIILWLLCVIFNTVS